MSTTAVVAGRVDVPAAYERCAAITRDRARNFHYGIRLLPPPKRAALCAVYAFARRIDDIGDGDLPTAAKTAQLRQVRDDLHHLDTRPDDPVLVALADAARRLPVPLDAFDDLIDGVEMDVLGHEYRSIDELVVYCRRVAGSIGRLSLGVFGCGGDPLESARRADALGVALQLTNILRDIREDALGGRVYLPADDLAAFGVPPAALALGSPDSQLVALVRYEADRAETWYADGLRLVADLDRRSAACCAAMAGIYRRLLHRIAADPAHALSTRISLSGWEKATVAVRSLLGAAA